MLDITAVTARWLSGQVVESGWLAVEATRPEMRS
jgi:hypothetical protein